MAFDNPRDYAYICEACDHPLSGHRLSPSAADVAGPYPCTVTGCSCHYHQGEPSMIVDKATYDARYAPG